jgi:head-tail adaptor
MSLLDEYMQDCTLIDQVRASDGAGGFITDYKEVATFKAAITRNSTLEALRAEKEGVTSVWTITTQKNVNLKYHDVVKDSKGAYFRVTSQGGEYATPNSATLNISQVQAEKWELTT